MDPAPGSGPQSYAPTASRIGAVGVGVFALWWVGDLAVRGDLARLAGELPWLLLGCLIAYAVFWRPAVFVDDDGVTLRNLVRDVRVPWPALTGVDTRYALTLITDQCRYQSWAAAAQGRPGLVRRGFSDHGRVRSGTEGEPGRGTSRHLPEAGRRDAPDPRWLGEASRVERSSAALTSDSGAAAFLVQQRLERWRTAQLVRRPPVDVRDEGEPTPKVTWNVVLVAAMAACLIAGLIATRL